ncbi:MAG TPA: ABC transporter substrate-binding protein [Azospirillum sp.]
MARGRMAFCGVVLALAVSCGAARAATPPQRIVSLNLCGDQLAWMLAGRGRIAALSHLARSAELSQVAPQVADVPIIHGSAEEILPLAPDLVLAGRYTAKPTVAFLRTKGVPILELAIPQDFAGIRDQVRRVAKALGTEARGEELIAAMDATLAHPPPPHDGRRPVAVAWQAGGFTAGAGTLTDAVLDAAGFDNLATLRGLKGHGYLTLESIVAGHPDVLVAEAALPSRPSMRQALLLHPALARPGALGRRVTIPAPLLACGTPATAEAVRLLRAAQTQGETP